MFAFYSFALQILPRALEHQHHQFRLQKCWVLRPVHQISHFQFVQSFVDCLLTGLSNTSDRNLKKPPLQKAVEIHAEEVLEQNFSIEIWSVLRFLRCLRLIRIFSIAVAILRWMTIIRDLIGAGGRRVDLCSYGACGVGLEITYVNSLLKPLDGWNLH